ncbi:MAG TPA: DUF2786 domain-containing protein [Polyangiales bacterium]|nr:DUF2786 domain-containing protein [Polyangiales bacterium]
MRAREDLRSAALLRQLARHYADFNWQYFGNRLQSLPLGVIDQVSQLGRYTRDPRRIELSSALISEHAWGVVLEVLKHEMAHQFVAEVLGETEESSHGPSFQRVCERMGIDARASGLPEAKPAERSPILERIRKLFALAQSDNQHEAEVAMRAAHRLMLRHNVQEVSDGASPDFGFRHLGRATGRVSEAESVLAALLGEFFFVQPIWIGVFRVHDAKRASVLEITGRHENLAMAEYVHGFLLQTAEALWREHKSARGIAGNADRRAFQAGVMRGFAEKLRAERKREAGAGLVWVGDAAADRYFERRHPRVRTTSYGSSEHSDAASHGHAAGREIVLSRPLARGQSGERRALPRGS